MFNKKRAIKVTLDKVDKKKDSTDEAPESTFEEKTDYVLAQVKELGKAVFVGICIYVVVDTCRQVAVAKASN